MAYVIRRGYSGIAVAKLQNYLTNLRSLYSNIPILAEDGIFGARTEEAVRMFQYDTGLVSDGIVGTLTWDKIISKFKTLTNPRPSTPIRYQPPLEYGTSGLDVQKMQGYLNQLTAPTTPLVVDGNYGSATHAKVVYYQKANHLIQDGRIGTNTWDSIIENI